MRALGAVMVRISCCSSESQTFAERVVMALFDVYQIVDKSVLLGQECTNIYYYQQDSAVDAPNAEDVAAAYIGQVLPLVKTIQEADLLHTEILVTNLFNPSDTFTQAVSVPGTATFGTELLPIFSATGFRLVGDNGAVRNGAKRYAGMDEGVQDDGVITNGTFITQLDAIADQLFATLNHGIIPTYVPVIVKRLLSGTDYVLPDNLGDAVLSHVVEAAFDTLVTSQVSRKVGSGS